MPLKTNPKDFRWWFWLVTLLFILGALLGWTTCYYLAISASLVHALFFLEQNKSLTDFETQLRVAFFVLTLFGLWPGVRIVVFVFLAAETLLITFFDRSFLARALLRMPWNRERGTR